MIDDAWRELHQSRFPELPFDCGNRTDPGILDTADMRDWSTKATTPDQQRIESYLDRCDLRAKRILHIGIGNSSLARHFYRRAGEIVGTTVDEPELRVAQGLGLPNYTAVLHNKYSGQSEAVPGAFDFIVDNNPTSACCCISHLAELFSFFDAKLAVAGQFVTEAVGLAWVASDRDARWSFDFEDLAAAAAAAGFSTYQATRNIYVVTRGQPPRSRLLPSLRHSLRQASSFPRKLIAIMRRPLRIVRRVGPPR